MLVSTDKVYYFTFVAPFNVPSMEGIYIVHKILTYAEIIADGINMVEFLYGKVGTPPLGEEDWNAARPGFVEDAFYKLGKKNVDEEEIIYVPESLLASYPDDQVAEYHQISLFSDLGAFADPDVLLTLKNSLKAIMSSDYGITITPELATYKKEWMLTSAYTAIEVAREAAKHDIVNWYSRCKQLDAQVIALNTKIAALEAIIIDLQTP